MGRIIKYSEDFKAKALKMFDEVGPQKTCKELGVANQTLYRWRQEKRMREPMKNENGEQTEQQEQLSMNQPTLSVDEKAEMNPNKDEKPITSRKPAHEGFLLDEVKRLKSENQRLQGTLDYLIQENKVLLERQQRCLEAIALLVR